MKIIYLQDLDFTSLLSGDMETAELWTDTDLNLLTTKTDTINISYGDVLHKPFLQRNRGDLQFTGITVIDTSGLSEFDHTLVCLVVLSLQETRMLDSWMVLSDFDLMDNKKFKSDLESIFYFSNANRLLLHFTRVLHMKSYYNKLLKAL